jgi:hypothetical protein
MRPRPPSFGTAVFSKRRSPPPHKSGPVRAGSERAGLILVEHSSRVVGIWLNHKPLDGDTAVNNGLLHQLSFSVFADERRAVRQLSIGSKESLPQGINLADHILAAEQPIFPGLPCLKQLFNTGQAAHVG